MLVLDLKWRIFLFQAFVLRVPDCFCIHHHCHSLLATRKCFTEQNPRFFLAKKSKLKEFMLLLENDPLKFFYARCLALSPCSFSYFPGRVVMCRGKVGIVSGHDSVHLSCPHHW